MHFHSYTSNKINLTYKVGPPLEKFSGSAPGKEDGVIAKIHLMKYIFEMISTTTGQILIKLDTKQAWEKGIFQLQMQDCTRMLFYEIFYRNTEPISTRYIVQCKAFSV